jgi:hypothetical protein
MAASELNDLLDKRTVRGSNEASTSANNTSARAASTISRPGDNSKVTGTNEAIGELLLFQFLQKYETGIRYVSIEAKVEIILR